MEIIIYGKDNCNFCTQAKLLCDMMNLNYEYLNASSDSDILDFLTSKGFRSVPQIYVDSTHVGGFTEFKEFISDKT